MTFFLTGLFTGALSALPFDYGDRGWATKWGIMTVVMTLLYWFLTWLLLPHFIGPLFGPAAVLVLVGWVVTAFISGMNHGTAPVTVLPPVVLTAILVIAVIAGGGMFRSTEYHAFVGERVEKREWETDMQPVDTAHIRMVSKKQALWRANKAFGQAEGTLGSKYQIGELTIQKVGDELMWVAPLEFQGFRSWQRFDTTPGYVKVSAEDPRSEAELVIGHKFRYVPSAYWGDNLDRHLYRNGYQFLGTTEYSFEIDDTGNPFYVATVYEPTVSYWGEKVTGVAIVDPNTGDIAFKAMDEIPEWVERVIPRTIAEDWLTWYGEYVHGWWNSVWGEEDINIPTETSDENNLWLTWGSDGRAYWFTGLTSSKSTDDSLVGFILMDSRTGDVREYRLAGADESGVESAVNSAVSNYSGWSATQPVLYNIYGELTWVVPVISEDGIFQRLALVRANEVVVALGKDKAEALREYRKLLSGTRNSDAPVHNAEFNKTIQGTIDRFGSTVQDGSKMFYLTLAEDAKNRIFVGSANTSDELVIARKGDPVQISYIETTESSVPMSTFNIVGFQTRVTAKQMEADTRAAAKVEEGVKRRSASDIRAKVKNLSDDEVLKQFGTNPEITPPAAQPPPL